ncbi:MAG: tetratricopeptide repeat protein [bacterium]
MEINIFIKEIVLCIILCLFINCAHRKIVRGDLTAIRTGMDSVKTELSSIQESLARQNELLRMVRAEQQVRFNDLEQNVTSVSGNVLESQDKLSRIDEKTQAIKRGWEEKLLADSLSGASKLAEIESLFEVAINDYLAGKRSVALAGFRDIALRFPETDRGRESEYWIGDCLYSERSFEQAEEALKNYLKKNPEGTKVCSALFKLGLIFDKHKKLDERNLLWSNLLEKCPKSEESQIATQRMK